MFELFLFVNAGRHEIYRLVFKRHKNGNSSAPGEGGLHSAIQLEKLDKFTMLAI